MFPGQVSNPVSLVGFRYFSAKEAEILAQRVLRDDPSKSVMRRYINRQELLSAVSRSYRFNATKRTIISWPV